MLDPTLRFLPAAKWQRKMAAAGIEHENLSTLRRLWLGRDESMRVRLVPPSFERLEPGDPCLYLAQHRWGLYPNSVRAVCPVETHAPLLAGRTKKLVVCPACQAQVEIEGHLLFHGAIKGRGGFLVSLGLRDWPIIAEMLDQDCLGWEKGAEVELWREGGELHFERLDADPVDQADYELAMGAASTNIAPYTLKPELLDMMAQAQDGWESAGRPNPTPGQAEALLALLPTEILLDIPWGFKAPQRFGWRETPASARTNADYLRALDSGNIGLHCGLREISPGVWQLTIGLDADTDAIAAEFEEINPWLRGTFCVVGARGKKWFFHLRGTKSQLEACAHSTKIKRGDKEVGDWLANGKQGVVFGLHPNGLFYRHNGKPLATIAAGTADLAFPTGCYFARQPAVKPQFRAGGKLMGRSADRHVSTRVVRSALAAIPPDERGDWFTVACALKVYGRQINNLELARTFFDEWSAGSTKYDQGGQDKLWDSLGGNGITLGSLFFLAHNHGWRTDENDTYDTYD